MWTVESIKLLLKFPKKMFQDFLEFLKRPATKYFGNLEDMSIDV